MIIIIDYGLGNLRSIQNMLYREGIESAISSEPDAIRKASRLVLPGVGHFGYGMDTLREQGFVEVLNECVLDRHVPILGICLGAQLLGRSSEEGNCEGLGWLPVKTVAFDRSRLQKREKVPHMGWAETKHTKHTLFEGLEEDARFYYVHSYHLQCDDPGMTICTAHHGYEFVAGVACRNILGVQFHPEKSHLFGKHFLRNFAAMEFTD